MAKPTGWKSCFFVFLLVSLMPAAEAERPIRSARLTYATYFGGNFDDSIAAMATDRLGNVYVVGSTNSVDIPATLIIHPPAGDGNCARGNSSQFPVRVSCPNVFVAKLSAAGQLLWSTRVGGAGTDTATGVAVDEAGNVYVTGTTDSPDFPVTSTRINSMPPERQSGQDGFLFKLDSTGSRLLYSSQVGGAQNDSVNALVIHPSGYVYIVGSTSSADFPLVLARQPRLEGDCGNRFFPMPCADAFLMRLRASDMAVQYSTFLGGSGEDIARAVAVDVAGNAYVTGSTTSANFPLQNALQRNAGGGTCQVESGQRTTACPDAFVSQISLNGQTLIYSTLLGGSNSDNANAIAVDATGNVVIAGETASPNLPVTPGALPYPGVGRCFSPTGSDRACTHAFAAKLTPQGTAFSYVTYMRGNSDSVATSIAMDATGNVRVAGWTNSSNFPITAGAWQHCNSNSQSIFSRIGFLAELQADGVLAYSTYWGGTVLDQVSAIAITPQGEVYLAGSTGSGDLPTTAGSLQQRYGGYSRDGFIAKLDFAGGLPPGPRLDHGCIVNAASFQSGPVAPGELVTLFGSGLGPTAGLGATLDAQGRIASSLGGTSVLFDGVPAPLLYVGANQINVVVPFAVANRSATQIVVQANGLTSAPTTMGVVAIVPGVFSLSSDGSGQAVVLNQDGSLNSASRPASKGSIITLWITGAGLLSRSYRDGEIVAASGGMLIERLDAHIGSAPIMEVLYAGQAPGMVAGVMQLNLRVPLDAPSGARSFLYLRVGTTYSQQQPGVTVAIE